MTLIPAATAASSINKLNTIRVWGKITRIVGLVVEDAVGQLVLKQGGLQGQIGGVGVALGVQVFDPEQGLGHFGRKGLLNTCVQGVGPGQSGVVGMQDQHVGRGGQCAAGQDQHKEKKENVRHPTCLRPNRHGFKPVGRKGFF